MLRTLVPVAYGTREHRAHEPPPDRDDRQHHEERPRQPRVLSQHHLLLTTSRARRRRDAPSRGRTPRCPRARPPAGAPPARTGAALPRAPGRPGRGSPPPLPLASAPGRSPRAPPARPRRPRRCRRTTARGRRPRGSPASRSLSRQRRHARRVEQAIEPGEVGELQVEPRHAVGTDEDVAHDRLGRHPVVEVGHGQRLSRGDRQRGEDPRAAPADVLGDGLLLHGARRADAPQAQVHEDLQALALPPLAARGRRPGQGVVRQAVAASGLGLVALRRDAPHEHHAGHALPVRARARVPHESEDLVRGLGEVVAAEVARQRQGEGEHLPDAVGVLQGERRAAVRGVVGRRHLLPGGAVGVVALHPHGHAEAHARVSAALGRRHGGVSREGRGRGLVRPRRGSDLLLVSVPVRVHLREVRPLLRAAPPPGRWPGPGRRGRRRRSRCRSRGRCRAWSRPRTRPRPSSGGCSRRGRPRRRPCPWCSRKAQRSRTP